MPTKPKSPPKKRIENSTQKLESPVEFPRSSVPRDIAVKLLQKQNPDEEIHTGADWTKNTRNSGIAPMNGPKVYRISSPHDNDPAKAIGNSIFKDRHAR